MEGAGPAVQQWCTGWCAALAQAANGTTATGSSSFWQLALLWLLALGLGWLVRRWAPCSATATAVRRVGPGAQAAAGTSPSRADRSLLAGLAAGPLSKWHLPLFVLPFVARSSPGPR